MCQVYGPTCHIACSRCGAGYYEGSPHECLVFIPFEKWDAALQSRAAKPYTGTNYLLQTAHACTQHVASWPEWKRRWAWAEEFQYSVTEPRGGTSGEQLGLAQEKVW